jgi:vacuolar-type H+-ATPase subunit H
MEDTLKRLLEAEKEAERMVDEAKSERNRIVEQALANTQAEEKRFAQRIPEIHADFLKKAETRAEQSIGELKRRYEERTRQLSSLAGQNEEEALESAVELILEYLQSEH